MDLIDLTLDSEDESPPVASTSRLAPASVNNAQSQPRQPAAHSKSAGKSARKGLRLNATSSSRPRSGDKGNGKGKNRIEIEISDDDDLVNGAGPSRVGQHNGAAGGMRAAAHQSTSTSEAVIEEIVLDSDSDSSVPTSPRFPPRHPKQSERTPTAVVASTAGNASAEATTSVARIVGHEPDSTPKKSSALTSTSRTQAEANSSAERGLEAGGRVDLGEGSAGQRGVEAEGSTETTPRAKSTLARSGSPTGPHRTGDSSAPAVDVTPKASQAKANDCEGGRGNGNGKEKAIDKDLFTNHDGEANPLADQQQAPSPGKTIEPLGSRTPSPNRSQLASSGSSRNAVPSASAPSCASPPPSTLSPKQSTLTTPASSVPDKAPNPAPGSIQQPMASTGSSVSHSDVANPLRLHDEQETLHLSSSSERGDSPHYGDRDSDRDSDIEIISVSTATRTAPGQRWELERKRREDRELRQIQKKMAKLQAIKARLEAEERGKSGPSICQNRDSPAAQSSETAGVELEGTDQDPVAREGGEAARDLEQLEIEQVEKERIDGENARSKSSSEEVAQRLQPDAAMRVGHEKQTDGGFAEAQFPQDQDEDSEAALELDRFCEVELPQAEAEARMYRNALDDIMKDRFDRALGHLIASEGVSTADEYRDMVERVKQVFLRKTGVPSTSDSAVRASEVEMGNVDLSRNVSPPAGAPVSARPEPVAQTPTVANGFADSGESSSDDEHADVTKNAIDRKNFHERPIGFAQGNETSEDEVAETPAPESNIPPSTSVRCKTELVDENDSDAPKPTLSRFASESESDEEDAKPDVRKTTCSLDTKTPNFSSLRVTSKTAGQGFAREGSESSDSSPTGCPAQLPDAVVLGQRQDEEVRETSSTPVSQPPGQDKKSSKLHKTAKKSTGAFGKPVNDHFRSAVKSTNGGLVFPRASLPVAAARDDISLSPDPLSLGFDPRLASSRRKRGSDEEPRAKKRRRRPRRIASNRDNLPSGASGTSTPESAKQPGTTLSTGDRTVNDSPIEFDAPLGVGNAGHDDAFPRSTEVEEKAFKQTQRLLPSYQRLIAGPSYDLHDEFPQTIQAAVHKRERDWARLHLGGGPPIRDGYKFLYEQMIYDANAKEFAPGRQPSIRIIPLEDARPTDYSSPEFELCYTNRVIYADGIVPDQAPGCACRGDCASPENRRTCACLRRQIAASTTRVGGGERSGHQGFAYDANGILNEKVFKSNDPIIECNSQCGCGEGCINRVVGLKTALTIDIFRTEDKGWGIRNPESYDDPLVGSHTGRTIKKGEPLGIYAGELLTAEEVALRDALVYSKTHRCYTYSLDAWTIGEDYKALASKNNADKMVVSASNASHLIPPHAKPTAKKSSKLARTPRTQGSARVGSHAPIKQEATEPKSGDATSDDEFSAIYNVDAFSYGNWTRFANHNCQGFNVVTRTTYVDESNVTRPLWVYVASRDIKPGDEISISYFSETEPKLKDAGLTSIREWQRRAEELRLEQPKNFRCYCNKPLCRGIMFNPHGETFFFNKFL